MVGRVAETVRAARFEFDDPVDALACGVDDPGEDERFDLVPPGGNRLGEGQEFGQVGVVGAPLVEGVQPVGDRGADGVGPGQGEQVPQPLLGLPAGKNVPAVGSGPGQVAFQNGDPLGGEVLAGWISAAAGGRTRDPRPGRVGRAWPR